MSEMIERVARAILARTLRRDSYVHDPQVGDRCVCSRCVARAAILAMREPTYEMIAIGKGTPCGHSWGSAGEFVMDPETIYEAMIDAALKE